MRTIKFRGKRLYDGEWVYGYPLIVDNEKYKSANIVTLDEVYPDTLAKVTTSVEFNTLGQFTGLHDKNGKEIYEGDILRTPQKKDYDKENYVAYEVFWHDNDCASHHIGWQMNRCHFQGCICGTTYIPEFLPKTTATMEVIGNIHDNPELLGKKGGEE